MTRLPGGIDERYDMAYWFPRLATTGVSVPETVLVSTDANLRAMLDGPPVDGFKELCTHLEQAAATVGGYPVFLRTGHLSGKHSWKRTCFVASVDELPQHIMALVEETELSDWLGELSVKTWAVRRFVRLQSTFTAFDGTPITRERRYFVSPGVVICHHPYWPPEAIADGWNHSHGDWRQLLVQLNAENHEEITLLTDLSLRVSHAFDGRWSLDWAQTEAGDWLAIDMAPAERSYHWPECPADTRAVETP